MVNALAEMEVLFQREADGSLLNLTEAGPLLLLDDGFGGEIILLSISVSDPDPLDPHVFGPPGSGSISQSDGSGSGSFHH